MEDSRFLRFLTVRLYSYDMNKLMNSDAPKCWRSLYCLSPLLPCRYAVFAAQFLGERREGDC